MPDPAYRIVVPTRNSALWVTEFHTEYEQMGLRPLYLCDTRSSDRTMEVLSNAGADIVPVTPQFDRVESILAATKEIVDSDWVIRFDDDELPSRALIAWLDRALARVEATTIAFSRRDALRLGGHLSYSRLEDYYFHPHDPSYLDPQWRAFRPSVVEFTDGIHTPGFNLVAFETAPRKAYFVHFDWILRSFSQRVAKLQGYERQNPGAGWGFANFYLQELHSPDDAHWTAFETTEFEPLASRLEVSAAKLFRNAPQWSGHSPAR